MRLGNYVRQRSSQSSSPSFLRLQLRVGRMVSSYIYQFSVRVVQVVSSGLAPYKLPRALDSLLIYQQPSSTTLYYSHQEHLFLTEARLRNETGGIASYHIEGCLSSFVCVSHFLKTVCA